MTAWPTLSLFVAASFLAAPDGTPASPTPAAAVKAEAQLGLALPPGFTASLFAGDELAHDIFSLTVDPKGNVVVSGPGYIKRLIAEGNPPRAVRAETLHAGPKSGAYGLCFAEGSMFYTGDGVLARLPLSADGEAKNVKPEVWAQLKSTEHGAHSIRQGPDGWLYVLCGNDAGVSSKLITSSRSPVREPSCGTLLRYSRDGRQCECVADGFRNPVDFDFNAAGHVFLVDSDGERDQYLPWYAPTRLFDVGQGGHHGWVNAGWQSSWSRPGCWKDSVERLVEIGRGSPTGGVVYRHTTFPEHYRGGYFSCCWTFGRIDFFPLVRQGASYTSRLEPFLSPSTTAAFAPTGIAVGPAGELFVAVGGRGTKGGVYRIVYRGAESPPPSRPTDELTSVLQAPQPLVAWSREKWTPAARRLGSEPFLRALAEEERPETERVRAVEILVDLFDSLPLETARQIDSDALPQLTARAAWAMARGRDPGGDAIRLLGKWTKSIHPHVMRATWESLALTGLGAGGDEIAQFNLEAALGDRRIALAQQRAFARSPAMAKPTDDDLPIVWPVELRSLSLAERLVQLDGGLASRKSPAERLRLVRWMMLALGDVVASDAKPSLYNGYATRRSPGNTAAPAAVALFPTGDLELDRELARLLGLLQVESPRLLESVAAKCTEPTAPTDDLHFLIVLSRLPGKRTSEVTRLTAAALARLHHKMVERQFYASRNWPDRVQELVTALSARDPLLPEALVKDSKFSLPAQAGLAEHFPLALRQSAARRLVEAAKRDADLLWSAPLVKLVSSLPEDESLPLLRAHWSDMNLRDALVGPLAKSRRADDRPRLVEALSSLSAPAVRQAAEALASMNKMTEPTELSAAIAALKRACQSEKEPETRRALVALLETWSGERFKIEADPDDLIAAHRPWFDWFARKYPDAAARLAASTSADWPQWKTRLGAIDWQRGEVARGKFVFEQRQCGKCHAGTTRLGPDLAGAAARFSRDDLFLAVIDPSRDVSPTYRTTDVVTAAGKTFTGIIVYESPESTLLQAGPDETVRIAGDEIVALRPSRQSLMPVGLLQSAGDAEVADLYTYLKSLAPRP